MKINLFLHEKNPSEPYFKALIWKSSYLIPISLTRQIRLIRI